MVKSKISIKSELNEKLHDALPTFNEMMVFIKDGIRHLNCIPDSLDNLVGLLEDLLIDSSKMLDLEISESHRLTFETTYESFSKLYDFMLNLEKKRKKIRFRLLKR